MKHLVHDLSPRAANLLSDLGLQEHHTLCLQLSLSLGTAFSSLMSPEGEGEIS